MHVNIIRLDVIKAAKRVITVSLSCDVGSQTS